MNTEAGKISVEGTGVRRSVKLTGPVVAAIVILVIAIGAYPTISGLIKAKNLARQSSELLARGESQLSEGKIDDAVFSYMKAVKLTPTEPGLHLGLAKALMLNGNGDAALKAVDDELAIDESSLDAHMLAGFINLLKSTRDDPLGRFLKAELPTEMGYPGMTGGSPVFQNDEGFPLTDALFHFKFVEEAMPHEIRAAVGLAVMKALEGDKEETERRLDEIIQRDPDNEFVANAVVRMPMLISQPGFGSMGGHNLPGMPPGINGDALLPLDTGWLEGEEAQLPVEEDTVPTGPPDISGTGGKELPTPEGTESEYIDPPEAYVNEDGELVLTPKAFDKDPETRPVGTINILPGRDLNTASVKIGNRFENGIVVLKIGEKAVVPNSGRTVEILEIPMVNKVVILEDGIPYTWVRGKVEWVLLPPDDTDDESDSSDEAPSEEE